MSAFCPECGAAYPEMGDRCWLCGRLLPEQPLALAGRAPAHRTGPVAPWTFGLSSLFMVMTLVAVCLGAGAAAPGLGIGLAIVAAPALVRTFVASARRKAKGSRLSVGEKLMAFAGSLGVVATIWVAAGIAFFGTCWVGFFGGALVGAGSSRGGYEPFVLGLWTGAVLGIIVGAYVGYRMIRWLWPQERRSQKDRK